jgi:hypothetical protein
VGERLPFVQQACWGMPDQTVNGMACKHYVCDVGNLQGEAGMTSLYDVNAPIQIGPPR